VIKGGTDSENNSVTNLMPEGVPDGDSAIEMGPISRKNKITDQLEGYGETPAQWDPDRRQSVASASAVILINPEGTEMGPEADDQTKKEIKESLERRKKLR